MFGLPVMINLFTCKDCAIKHYLKAWHRQHEDKYMQCRCSKGERGLVLEIGHGEKGCRGIMREEKNDGI